MNKGDVSKGIAAPWRHRSFNEVEQNAVLLKLGYKSAKGYSSDYAAMRKEFLGHVALLYGTSHE